ncbi:sensor histidine kinase [Paenibacillus sp. NPDC058071]|uniref:sensor histidine kinase n=1 Tax=Paenibacillus sp. NPDC058071 TaxID=3346326 RepID=UPI0036DE080D
MKTLYVRIVLTFMGVAIVSSVAGLFFTNAYYKEKLLSQNEVKTMKTAVAVKDLYEHTPGMSLSGYLTQLASLGYQFHLVDSDHKEQSFGAPFKQGTLEPEQYETVLQGNVYQGMNRDNEGMTLFAFFVNSIRNTVGVPVETPEGRAALFVRPDLQQQMGEMRLIMAVFIGSTFIASLLLIVILSRSIVSPVKKLTRATRQIAKGDYDVRLEGQRKDEIGELARHFTKMTASIKSSEEMRQQFVANVSHEFQTPLTSIRGLARAASDPEAAPTDAAQYLHIIEEESERLSSLSRQLLTLASLDHAAELERVNFRLDEQIRQLMITLEWQWSDKKLQLELDLPETIAIGDPSLLYQVWLNLIANSIKFCDENDILRVSIERNISSSNIVVTISDTGPGIADADLPKLFDRFYKADPSRNRTTAGSGLGLSIVQKIAHLHGGQISVSSVYGQGTTFTVILPAP